MNGCCSKQTFLHISLLTLLSAIVLFGNLGGAKLWDRDEPRNAGCAREMIERGNFVTPIFNDEMRGAKPALLYWLIISAYEVFGVNEFAARFWSAVLGLGTVLLTYASGRRLFNQQAGLLAAIVLLTSMMFVVAGRAATPDSVLIFFVTLAITFFIYGAFPKDAQTGIVSPNKTPEGAEFPKSWTMAALMYAALGFAVLGKGPVGMILPMAIVGMYLLIVRLPEADQQQNRGSFSKMLRNIARTFHPVHFARTLWAMRPLTAIGMVLLVAAPWYIVVGFYTEGDFISTFFLKEHFGRATMAMEDHNGNVLYYPMMLMMGLFPWSVFTLPLIIVLVRSIRRNDPWRNGYILGICWVSVWIAAFTVARTKLPSYATPCYPGAALLIGCFLQRWIERPINLPAWTYRVSLGCLAGAGLVIAVVLPLATAHYLGGEQWLFVVGLIPLTGGIIALYFQWKSLASRAVTTVATTAVAYSFMLFVVGAASVSKYQTTPQLLSAIESDDETKPSLGVFHCMESSWVYYSKLPVHELEKEPLANGFQDRTRDWQVKPKFDVQTFIETQPSPYILTIEPRVKQLRRFAGVELEEVSRTKYFLNGQTLVLLRPVDCDAPIGMTANQADSKQPIVR